MPELPTPTDRLLRGTRRRLFAVTFGLVATLVVGVGAATAIAGLAALDADVDRALQAAVDSAVASPPADSGEGTEVDDVSPASADTFVLFLDAPGAVVADPSRIRLVDLPVAGGVAAVRAGATQDWRTVTADGRQIRMLTVAMPPGAETRAAFVQGGFVLTLHDAQSQSLVATVVGAGAAGLLAAAAITLIVTRRALVPIRRAIDGQRRFVADASHELRTPVAIIRADAEVLQREGHLDAGGQPLAADIVDEAARLGRLVGDLLTIASAEAQGLPLHLARLEIGPVVLETARRLEPLAAAREAVIEASAEDGLAVDGDRDRLVQLLVILIDNAVGHAPAGCAVEVTAGRAGANVEVAVRDHGPGVPETDRIRIFEPFTRGAGGRRDRAGSGLGLAIASAIVAAHRGAIRVDAAAGGGARFVVALPAAR
ncbi:MAG TPA: HAMP domain-containing sensor histidine kinase [Candidatus Binatus sp.]|nr:HAMP domain-containing sensor histidine kinase [Candidatus Binatus sp.]